MLKRLLTIDSRRYGFLVATALIVAYVRNFLQYQRYSFDSIWELLGFWLIHYIALFLLGGVFYASVRKAMRLFLYSSEGTREVSMDEAIVQFTVAVLITAVAIFVLAHWPQGMLDEE